MLELQFEGWFECRLATDPDPTDEPRGVSGWTCAVAGEPDLDRIIRTVPQEAVRRSFGPPIGVSVRKVLIDGRDLSDHCLLGAPVQLLDGPVFEGRNGLASEDTEEPIFPFHFRIEGNGAYLRREFRDLLSGRPAFEKSLGVISGEEITSATGITNPTAFRSERKRKLQERLNDTSDQTEQIALRKRIADLEQFATGMAVAAATLGLRYTYILQGPWFEVSDKKNLIGGILDGSPWIVRFWMGGWDADALAGYMKGLVQCPLVAIISK